MYLDFFMEAHKMNPDQTASSDLGLYYLQYRLYLRTKVDKRSRRQNCDKTVTGLLIKKRLRKSKTFYVYIGPDRQKFSA